MQFNIFDLMSLFLRTAQDLVENSTPMEEAPPDREEPAAIECRKEYVAQRIWTCDPSSKTSEELMGRFPSRNSCPHCKEEILSAFRPINYSPKFLRDVDSAIKAADSGCTLYEWLLDFVILSYAPKDLVRNDGFFIELKSLPGKMTDVHSVQFLIGTKTLTYSWPCASFDVFTDEGQ